MTQSVVRPKLGWYGWLYTITLPLAIIGAFTVLQAIAGGNRDPLYLLVFTLMWIIAPAIAVITIPGIYGIRVYQERLTRPKRFRLEVSFSWDKVASIKADGFSLDITFREPVDGVTRTFIITDWYVNVHEVRKSILEAAHLANPNVHIDEKLLKQYGFPPYGIFSRD